MPRQGPPSAVSGAVIMYGYNFPKNSKIGKSLDFYISSDGDVCRIVLSGEE